MAHSAGDSDMDPRSHATPRTRQHGAGRAWGEGAVRAYVILITQTDALIHKARDTEAAKHAGTRA